MTIERMLFVREEIGEDAVYPGHGVTTGLLIMKAFASFEEADNRDSTYRSSAASRSYKIPGSGGCVANALYILGMVKKGLITVEQAVTLADAAWEGVDDQKVRYPDRYREGQVQADKLKARYAETLRAWASK